MTPDARLLRGLAEFRDVFSVPAGVHIHAGEYVPTWRMQEPTLDELTYWQLLGHRRREPRPKPKLVRAFFMLDGEVHVSLENYDLLKRALGHAA